MFETLKQHWPEYLMEAAGLGTFMISACLFGALLEHPDSRIHQAIDNQGLRRGLMGVAMGLTAIGIIYSPWGKQSGAHINPSVTLTFWRLGKVASADAGFYMLAHFLGGVGGVLVATLALRGLLFHPSVNFVATLPGAYGTGVAFVAEFIISFLMMSVILSASNTERLTRFTGMFAGALVVVYITIEAPLSGMSMNPARSFGSAFGAQVWTALWIYFCAPPLGMLAAGELHLRLGGNHQVACAKLHHQNNKRCIFCGALGQTRATVTPIQIVT